VAIDRTAFDLEVSGFDVAKRFHACEEGIIVRSLDGAATVSSIPMRQIFFDC
jgi:hypothetical protein